MQVVEVDDASLGVERRRNNTLTAQHRAGAESSAKQIHMFHAVEQRQYRGVRADGRGKRIDRRWQIVGLAAQQDQIERRLKLIRKDRRRLRDGHVATRAADDQSGLRQLFGAARPHQKCHVAAGFLEPTAEIAAKRARADHQNAHHEILYARRLLSGGTARNQKIAGEHLHDFVVLIERRVADADHAAVGSRFRRAHFENFASNIQFVAGADCARPA